MALTADRRRHAAGEREPRLPARPPRWRWRRRGQVNMVGGLFAVIWLVLIAVPLWFILGSSLRPRDDFLESALPVPRNLTLDNYQLVLDSGFFTYFVNTAIVTVATVALTLALALPAAYAVIRSQNRLMQAGFSVFLLGLAVPAQAAIVPIYLMITRMRLYDSLTAIVLPTTAFALPLAIVVLAGSLRDVPRELYESMSIDGANAARIFRSLVLPLGRPAVIAVTIYTALAAWNGFLFPLIVTQDPSKRVLTLSLMQYQSEFNVNSPALLAAVVMSAIPFFFLFLFARRWLIAGLTGGFK